MAVKLLMLSFICLVLCVRSIESLPALTSAHYSMNINMPDVRPLTHDSYICTAKKLSPAEAYIVQYEPDADGQRAHHMLLFGCTGLHSQSNLYPGHWNCGIDICNGITIMYGWARNADAMKLPSNVGFYIGGNSSIEYLVLQIHYAKLLPEGVTDNSGLKLHITSERQQYITGIHLLMAENGVIPPYEPKYHIDVNCKYSETVPIHIFAYRVHSHKLGTVISGYKFNRQNNSWTFLAKGNPQWPQAFYPMDQIQTINSDDILAARCTYNSSTTSRAIKIGSTTSDEMCNLYLMYYTDYSAKSYNPFRPCVGIEFMDSLSDLPVGNDIPLPSNMALEHRANSYKGHVSAISYGDVEKEGFLNRKPAGPHSFNNGHYLNNNLEDRSHSRHTAADDNPYMPSHMNSEYQYNAVSGWPSSNLKFGQVSAVAIDAGGNVVIFHRGDHVWNELSFDAYNVYLPSRDHPIATSTIVTIDSVSGLVLQHWGSDLFFMPHGLTIDPSGQYWLTDVALHQVFLFPSGGSKQPILTLGEKFIPGKDKDHFCKPTSVAVGKNGDIYVADGYCNSRVLRFSSKGEFLNQWGKHANNYDPLAPTGTFNIPHKIVFLEDRDLVCVADRENGRIQCFSSGDGSYQFQIQHEDFGETLYSIAYAKDKGLLYAVNGKPMDRALSSKAFIFNVTDQKLLNVFFPPIETFSMPHDMYVSHDSEEVYVCEIGPNLVWKFQRAYHKSSKKVLPGEVPPHIEPSDEPFQHFGHAEMVPLNHVSSGESSSMEDDINSFETSLIVMALLGIPLLLLVLVTVFVRLRKRGKFHSCSLGHFKGWATGYQTPQPHKNFNLGNFLNPHKGFDKLSVEESDGDEGGSGSDAEEYHTTSTTKNA